jgi:DNA-binding response OmpR family regulator
MCNAASLDAKRRCYPKFRMPVVFIVSGEWDLRGAVRAELREAGVDALGMETVEDMAKAIAGGIAPDLVLLDGSYLHNPQTRQALQNIAARLPLLVVDSRLHPAPALPGAQIILRPVQVKDILARVLAMLARSPS